MVLVMPRWPADGISCIRGRISCTSSLATTSNDRVAVPSSLSQLRYSTPSFSSIHSHWAQSRLRVELLPWSSAEGGGPRWLLSRRWPCSGPGRSAVSRAGLHWSTARSIRLSWSRGGLQVSGTVRRHWHACSRLDVPPWNQTRPVALANGRSAPQAPWSFSTSWGHHGQFGR